MDASNQQEFKINEHAVVPVISQTRTENDDAIQNSIQTIETEVSEIGFEIERRPLSLLPGIGPRMSCCLSPAGVCVGGEGGGVYAA